MTKERKNEYFPDKVFHPGETLREKLEELEIGSKEFAIRTNKPEKTISKVLSGESRITPEMAVLFETVLDIPAGFWLRKQYSYDEYRAREERIKVVEESTKWAKLFSYNEMRKLNWVPNGKSIQAKTMALFQFFDMTSSESWENYYINKSLNGTFRLSLNGASNPYNLSAWLRQGEIKAKGIEIDKFDPKSFKASLPLLKNIMVDGNANYLDAVQKFCFQHNLKLVYVENIPHAPHGVSRWLNNEPIIQLSNKWNRYDIFWFTLFHEIGHILLHPSKFISLENVSYDEVDKEKETEADTFAAEYLFNKEDERHFIKYHRVDSLHDIKYYAAEINTHPSIILGRLMHRKKILPAKGIQLMNKLRV